MTPQNGSNCSKLNLSESIELALKLNRVRSNSIEKRFYLLANLTDKARRLELLLRMPPRTK